MTIWLVRAGAHGEYEQKFLQDNRVYLTWGSLNANLAELAKRDQLIELLADMEADPKPKRLLNHASQVWPFAKTMQPGDWVVVPMKNQPVIYIGEITSDYQYQPDGPQPFFHYRSVNWIGEAIPRTHFSQDLLYSFGAFMTICRIRRNNAEERLKAMKANGWQPETGKAAVAALNASETDLDAVDEDSAPDLEELANNQIVRLIEARFKGHNLTRLVSAILRSKGYTVWQSPEGADGGADILAGDGPMGFGDQRICVEVKSGDGLVDRSTVDKLLGAMTKFNANHGLFVSWGGFKGNVQKELASSFYRLRLWSQKDLLEELFTHYEQLDDEIKAELPLKRIWTVALAEDE